MAFEISYSDGLVEGPFSTIEDAIDHLRMQGLGFVVGHSGDLFDGGARSLFWERKEDAENDDGARAAGEIRRRRPDLNAPIGSRDYMNLRADAIEHGDDEQARLCTLAIAGDQAAKRECDRVIMDARANASELGAG